MTFIIYKDRRGEWRWRLRARNGRIVADSGEGYRRRRDCLMVVERLQWKLWEAKVVMR